MIKVMIVTQYLYIVHLQMEECKKLKCDACDSTFVHRQALFRHKKEQHGKGTI